VGERRARAERRRAREFEAFVAGAAGRLLHAATLLTGEPCGAAPAAQELLVGALSRTYADWDRLRGEDPYEHTRQDLAAHFAHTARRYRRPRGGLLDGLPPQERLMLVLRLYEGVAEEQAAASLGLPVERVRGLCTRGMTAVLSRGDERGAGGGTPPRAAPGEMRGATRTASLIASRIITGLRHRGGAGTARAVPPGRDGADREPEGVA
jgi:sigma-70-like protein